MFKDQFLWTNSTQTGTTELCKLLAGENAGSTAQQHPQSTKLFARLNPDQKELWLAEICDELRKRDN